MCPPVDIYTRHAAFGGTAVLLLVVARHTVLVGLVLALLCRLLVDVVDVGGVLIVVEQTVELKREYALEQIFGRQPRQFLLHAG